MTGGIPWDRASAEDILADHDELLRKTNPTDSRPWTERPPVMVLNAREWTSIGFAATPGLRMAAAEAEWAQHYALITGGVRSATVAFRLTALNMRALRRVFFPFWVPHVKLKPSDHRAKRHTLRRRR